MEPVIIHLLRLGENRFTLIQKVIPEISKQMLVNHFRELEIDGVIERKIYQGLPPRVEYSISPLRASLFLIVDAMKEWGLQKMNE